WYSCTDFTFSDGGTSRGQKAECAIYTAPLCYPGICSTSDPMIDIFVKRLPAVGVNAAKATNVWLVPGGTGQPSPDG
ncbi:hypothetical protein PHYSODRAFT_527557, partial [Phytophthora sojae]